MCSYKLSRLVGGLSERGMLGTGWTFHLPGIHTKQVGPSLCPIGQTSEPHLREKAGRDGVEEERKMKEEGERWCNFPTPR